MFKQKEKNSNCAYINKYENGEEKEFKKIELDGYFEEFFNFSSEEGHDLPLNNKIVHLNENTEDVMDIKHTAELSSEEEYIDISSSDKYEEKDKDVEYECFNCKILQKKYDIQVKNMIEKEKLQDEIMKLKKQLQSFEICDEESSSDSIEKISNTNILNCFIQLYIDYYPRYSRKDIPVDEMLSLAHGLALFINKCNEKRIVLLEIIISTISQKVFKNQKSLQILLFIQSNLMELQRIFNIKAIQYKSLMEEVNKLILYNIKKYVKRFIPHAIIEYQGLKNIKIKQSIIQKLLNSRNSSYNLVFQLEKLVNKFLFYRTPEQYIKKIFTYLLGYLDVQSANLLFTKKHFLSQQRCIQIKNNILQIKNFCKKLGIDETKTCPWVSEIIRVVMKFDNSNSTVLQLKNSILNNVQINRLVDISKVSSTNFSLEQKQSDCLYIKEPEITFELFKIPDWNISNFVRPLFIPKNSIKSIFKVLSSYE